MLAHCYGACSSAGAEGGRTAMSKSGLAVEREVAVWKSAFGFMSSKDGLNPKNFLYVITKAETVVGCTSCELKTESFLVLQVRY